MHWKQLFINVNNGVIRVIDEYSINESTQKYNFQQSYYSIAADEIHEGYNKKL